MDPVTSALIELAKTAGVSPVAAATMVPLTIILANRVARIIPDTAKGPLGVIRKIFAVLGLHVADNSGVPGIPTAPGVAIPQVVTDGTLAGGSGATDSRAGLPTGDSLSVGNNLFTAAAAANAANKES